MQRPFLAILLLAALPCPVLAQNAPDAVAFEARCAQLPEPHFEVTAVPFTYTEDVTQTIDQLTIKAGHRIETQMTFGLTVASFSYQTQFKLQVIDDRAVGRTCAAPSISVELSMQPVTVYVADEVMAFGCTAAATRSHEMKHVAAFQETLMEAARELRGDVAIKLAQSPIRASTPADIEAQFKAAVTGYLNAFMGRWRSTLDERQAAVDSQQEYSRVALLCP